VESESRELAVGQGQELGWAGLARLDKDRRLGWAGQKGGILRIRDEERSSCIE
jgi:hypothetical protein